MKNICFISGSRAEFDLIITLLILFEKSKSFNLYLILTGTHLSQQYGQTKEFIKKLNFKNIIKIHTDVRKSVPSNTLNSISLGINKFKFFFKKIKPDLLFLPGDRYELIPAALCGHFMNLRIAHIFGGDITSGSLDDSIRHAITKLSDYHFVTSKDSLKRVLQLGEDKKNTFLIGNPGLDSIVKTKYLSVKYFKKNMNINFSKNTALVVVHPDASSKVNTIKIIDNILTALSKIKEYNFIFNQPNSDNFSNEIHNKIQIFVKKNAGNSIYIKNFGHQKFLSILKISNFIIGNSSSGLSEMPFFNRPTINVGDRQSGRFKASSVIDCKDEVRDIELAINKSKNTSFLKKIKNQKYHLGKPGGSKKIIKIISKINFKKPKSYKVFNSID